MTDEVERLKKLNTILKSRLKTAERRAWQNREKMKAAEATRDKLQAHLIKAIDEKEAMEASFKTVPSAQWRATPPRYCRACGAMEYNPDGSIGCECSPASFDLTPPPATNRPTQPVLDDEWQNLAKRIG